MSGVRIVSRNVADLASISASSSAGAMLPVAMQNDMKSDVWRSVGSSATLTLIWPSAEVLQGVALCYANFSTETLIRVRAYELLTDAVPSYDSGNVLACPAPLLADFDFGVDPIGWSGYERGNAIAHQWIMPGVVCKKLVIDLYDPFSADGYLSVGRIVAGPVWSSSRGADLGASLSNQSTSKQFRTQAGDLLTDVGTQHRRLSFSLTALPQWERDRLWMHVSRHGLDRGFLISLFPDSLSTQYEQMHMMYGKLAQMPDFSSVLWNRMSIKLDVEEV